MCRCRCRCREVRGIPCTAISLTLKMEPVNSRLLMRCTRSKQPGQISRYFHPRFRNICLWKIRLWCERRIRSPANIREDCPFVAITFSAFSVLLVVEWLTTTSYQAIEAKDMCKLPNKPHSVPLLIQHSVFTISNVVCDDKISAHGKTVNWILQCESGGSFIIVTLRTVTAAKVTGLSRLSLVFSNFVIIICFRLLQSLLSSSATPLNQSEYTANSWYTFLIRINGWYQWYLWGFCK